MSEGIYGKPTNSGKQAGEDEEEESGRIQEDYGFGGTNMKEKNKR